MEKPNRKRKNAVTVRMNDAEYDELLCKVDEAGITQQSFIIGAISDAKVASAEEINALKEISRTFADMEKQLRGLATNGNQMARIANSKGDITAQDELESISSQVSSFRKESEKIWRLIRLSITRQKPPEE